jgi:aryl-alcohol dehydrogenase-like predicted oxidoreductase
MDVSLGCGLIALGRKWGTTMAVPTESEALQFLDAAYELGVRFFDTAPSYGVSEERLGAFLKHLTKSERHGITVATKFGEHWNPTTNSSYIDHSLDSLLNSLHQSYERLGKIDLIQLHKAAPEVLLATDTHRALEHAAQSIAHIGASVSDPESASMTIRSGSFQYIQFPYNEASPIFGDAIQEATSRSIRVITNRPFQMGSVVTNSLDTISPFRFILKRQFNGVVLTGTANIDHLRENLNSFEKALNGSKHTRQEH